MALMNRVRQFRIFCLGFLLALIPLSFTGCSTPLASAAPDAHLEKYRKVYLVQPKGDERNLAAGILSRLQVAGFDAAEMKVDDLKKLAAAKDEQAPAVACMFESISTYDYHRTWYCFETIQIYFFDVKSGKQVYKLGYFHPDSYIPENTELNRLFIQIRDNFFPGQPNIFRDNPRGPYGPSYSKFQMNQP